MGMLLTPPDIISQALLAIPMWVLFEVGILLGRAVSNKSQWQRINTVADILRGQLLTLKHMTFGNGLPATMDEMEYIQIQREKIAFENALPPTSDESSFLLRRKLMEEQEFKEWNKRETEIKKYTFLLFSINLTQIPL